MNYLFLGTAGILAVSAVYWLFGKGRPRPAGTTALCTMLASFSLAFASYAPLVCDAVEAVIPQVARLMSNSFSLLAATAVLVFMYQLNLAPEAARRLIRRRAGLLCLAIAMMTVLFVADYRANWSPQFYALYVVIYISYLSFVAGDFLRQTWIRSNSSRRTSQRFGLRLAASGCVVALVYAGYKIVVAVSVGFGLGLVSDRTRCSHLVVPVQCAFTVTAPALAVALIAAGLTLPAIIWPVSEYRRRRWEIRSFSALEQLWAELTAAAPQVVLTSDSEHDDADPAFLLHRRVIEINDSILALRAYRSVEAQHSVLEAAAIHGRPITNPDATLEAAILAGAVAAKQSGQPPGEQHAPPAPGTASRAGNLRAETNWLLQVARAYATSNFVKEPHQRGVGSTGKGTDDR